MRLEGKVALISGGARGMGAAEARLFAQEGASVVIGDVLEEEGRQVEAQIGEAGGHALFIRLDVTSESDWTTAVAAAVSRFGKLDILVNNAGIGSAGVNRNRTMVEETTEEDWERVMGVNAKGVFLGTRRYSRDAPGGRRLRHQHLVNIWPGRQRRFVGLPRIQRGGSAAHQIRRNPVCRRGH